MMYFFFNIADAELRDEAGIAQENIAEIRDIPTYGYFCIDWDVVTDITTNKIPLRTIWTKSLRVELDE